MEINSRLIVISGDRICSGDTGSPVPLQALRGDTVLLVPLRGECFRGTDIMAIGCSQLFFLCSLIMVVVAIAATHGRGTLHLVRIGQPVLLLSSPISVIPEAIRRHDSIFSVLGVVGMPIGQRGLLVSSSVAIGC